VLAISHFFLQRLDLANLLSVFGLQSRQLMRQVSNQIFLVTQLLFDAFNLSPEDLFFGRVWRLNLGIVVLYLWLKLVRLQKGLRWKCLVLVEQRQVSTLLLLVRTENILLFPKPLHNR